MHRRLVVLGRVLLLASRHRPAWVAGTATLSLAKILENMEIGHNVMHGQWDWMNDPQINSSTWDWDSASTAEAWKHSHNYVHHTFTNIRGKDRDLGYEIMRIDPHQKWHPVYLLQPLYNLVLAAFFEWGVAVHDLDFEAIRTGEKSKAEVSARAEGHGRQGAQPDRQGLRRVAADQRGCADGRRATLALGAAARAASATRPVAGGAAAVDRRVSVPIDPEGGLHREHRPQRLGLRDHLLRPLPRPDVHLQPGGGRGRDARRLVRPPAAGRREHRGQPALPRDQRQPRLPGRAPPVPGHAEHALRRDRAARASEICERYELPYNTGPFCKQLGTVQRTILRLAFPGGKPRPKPGPYRGDHAQRRHRPGRWPPWPLERAQRSLRVDV